ncbi:MAG: hypothetical protein OEM82_14710 [Acidobacteriota bacterium]|nr:hypothetical protein [Acidobacteriota bacterium]MDH3528383.1 hypothetical protein [Acidobacteriota bacterium]
MLPNSKFEFDISLFASVIDADAEDSGAEPDAYVEQQPDDVGNGFDRELEAAKNLIAGRDGPEKWASAN